jgi:drug/metabolite transporter (DMT)-like permease
MWAMSELNEMRCEQFADMAAELALGVLTGRERAEAIAHLDRCEACRENVRQLTVTGEELLGLLPASEPPPGFETRVMERLGLAAPRPGVIGRIRRFGRVRQAGWTRRTLAVAAIVLTFVVAGLGGWGLRSVTASPARSLLSSAPLVSAGHQTVGEVFFYNGNPQWLYMSVGMDAAGTGTVTCQLKSRDGRVVTVGSFRLTGGYGSWVSPAPVGQGPFTSVRLVSADGGVLATASFPGWRLLRRTAPPAGRPAR